MTRTKQRASNVIVESDKNKSATDSSASTSNIEQESSLRVISTQTEITSVLSMIVINGQHNLNPVILPMLIHLNDDHGNLGQESYNPISDMCHSIHLTSCILLQNLGISKVHWANSKTMGSSSSHNNQESLLKKSYNLFLLSHTLLDQLCKDDSTTKESSPEFCETLLLLELLLEYDLLGTSIQLGLEFHILLRHDEKLHSLYHWIHQRERLIQSGIIAASAA